MKLSGNFVRANFMLLKPLFNESAPENERHSMATIGKLLSRMGKSKVDVSEYAVNGLTVAMVSPKDELSRGVILYLHGGGYSGGDITYAKGFSTVLASLRCLPANTVLPQSIYFLPRLTTALQPTSICSPLAILPRKFYLREKAREEAYATPCV